MRQQRSRPDAAQPDNLELAVLEQSTTVAALLVSPEGRILGSNAHLRALLGVHGAHELEGRGLGEFLVDAADWSAWQQAMTAARALRMRLRARGGGAVALRGDVVAMRTGGVRVLCGTFVEVADDEKLRAAVQQSARMEALGSLTAGIAHDFNNLLTVLVGNLYLVAEDLRAQPKLFEKLKAARDAGKRGADLIKQLLTFARREQLVTGIIDPCKVISELAPLLRRALGSRIALETDLESAPVPIKASQAQLESVIVNLSINARDAIEGKGNVRVKVRRTQLGADDAARHRLASPGHYVVLSVSDDGAGIPQETISRVFEPFFSTKAERGGTGLGLSMVRWFAEQAGGVAELGSTVGKGTTVTLLLPLSQDQVVESHDMTMPLSTLPTGTERVLVLAADEALRATIRQILEVLGYTVSFAPDVEGLLATLQAEPVQLLIVDAAIREPDLFARAQAVRGGVKVLLTADAQGQVERSNAPGAAVLLKPFSLADLAGGVRRALDGA
jgi:signal transduction histidine kinase